jgi:LacI family transcriptional regulator
MNRHSSSSKLSQPTGVTVRDVAALAGVSTATVSRVLRGRGGVRKELEQRVQNAIQTLGYRPNLSARRLRERNAKIIGVLVQDIQIPFFASLVVGIDHVLQDAGYLLLLGNTNDIPEGEQQHINIFLAEDVSGIISPPADPTDMAHYRSLYKTGIPLVAIDREPGDLPIDTVQLNNHQAACQATQHLIQEGHNRIAFIGGRNKISTATQRQNGYESALIAAGIHIDPQLIQSGEFVQEGGYRAMNALLALPEPPGAVVIANNVMTLGALQCIHEHGLNIPCDIAVISFDDMPWASALRPPLTVIAQPANEIGIVAARLMLDRIREPLSSTKHVSLEARLILRGSCKCAGAAIPAR